MTANVHNFRGDDITFKLGCLKFRLYIMKYKNEEMECLFFLCVFGEKQRNLKPRLKEANP